LAHINQPLIGRDIYNIIAAGKRRNLNGQSPFHLFSRALKKKIVFPVCLKIIIESLLTSFSLSPLRLKYIET
jgi:hypothetical protein